MTKDNDKDINAKVDEVKDNLKALSSSLYGLTSESLSEINNAAKSIFDDEWVKSTFKDTWKDDWNEKWASDWQEEWRDNWREKTGWMKDLKRAWDFPSVYQSHDISEGSNSWSTGQNRAFEYYKYNIFNWYGLTENGTPSIRKYNKCLDKNGQQIYDTNGYWRCLFPNSEISNKVLNYKKENYPDLILTKEDFLDEVNSRGVDLNAGKYDLGEKGIFFKQFEDMMNWKSIMYKNVQNQTAEMRKRKRAEWKQKQEERKQKELNNSLAVEPVNTTDLSSSNVDPSKKVVSTSVESLYTYNDNNVVQKEIRTEYYEDGTSFTKTITKSKPDGQDWIVDESETTDSSKGWFWK